MIALTRPVDPSITDCELTYRERAPIDVERARRQHRAYEACLRSLGVEVRPLPPAPGRPDAVFAEDAAIVLDDVALLTRPGTASRRTEPDTVAPALRPLRRIRRMRAPGTIDGGDVLRVGRTLYVGRSRRTSAAGIRQLRALVAPHGYTVREVAVRGCLHLRTACSRIGDERLLVQRDWVDADAFPGLELIDVAPSEPWGANAVLVGRTVVMGAGVPETRERVRATGAAVRTVDVSEFLKAEGGVSCLSLRIGG